MRITLQRVGKVEGDVTLKLEAPNGLTVPAQIVVEQGRQEVSARSRVEGDNCSDANPVRLQES